MHTHLDYLHCNERHTLFLSRLDYNYHPEFVLGISPRVSYRGAIGWLFRVNILVTQKVDLRRKTLPFVVDFSFLNEECQMATIGNLHFCYYHQFFVVGRWWFCSFVDNTRCSFEVIFTNNKNWKWKLAGYSESSSVIELILGVSFFRAYKNGFL